MFAALSTRLWFLQVLATESTRRRPQNNSVRTAKTDALRGEIWTADQFAQAAGRAPMPARDQPQEPRGPGQQAGARRERPSRAGAAAPVRDARHPGRGDHDKLEDKQYFDFQPKPVAEFVDEEVRFYIEEHAEQFPGVEVVDASVRAYPMGTTAAAHRSGGSGRSKPTSSRKTPTGTTASTTSWARAGVEVTYEKWLRGRKGVQRYVVNADGETIRDLVREAATARRQPGPHARRRGAAGVRGGARGRHRAGHARSSTTTDATSTSRRHAGAVVVLDAKTGGVVAMASIAQLRPAMVRPRAQAATRTATWVPE